jgi:hypothetical protein
MAAAADSIFDNRPKVISRINGQSNPAKIAGGLVTRSGGTTPPPISVPPYVSPDGPPRQNKFIRINIKTHRTNPKDFSSAETTLLTC